MDPRLELPARGVARLQTSPAWQQIEREFVRTGDAAQLHHRLSRVVDDTALAAYAATVEQVHTQATAVVAIGALGRREIYPYSDVDIVVLLDDEPVRPELREALNEFVRLLWEPGLRLGQPMRTVSECLELRELTLDFSIGLLDRRLLGGNRALFEKLDARLPAFYAKHGARLSQHLCQLARLRHAKFRATSSHLEPDVKDAPGAVRDLQFLHWMSLLAPDHVADTPDAGARAATARCFLHYQLQGDRNLFDRESQEQLVAQPFAAGATVEEWMRGYYAETRHVFHETRRAMDLVERAGPSLLDNFHDWRTRLSNAEFTVSRERVLLRNQSHLDADPALVFRLLEFIARHGIPAAAETERRLEASREAVAAFCATPRKLWPVLKSIFALPFAALALRTLEATSLLSAVLSEWSVVEGRTVDDPTHSYTLDEQTLFAIEQLNALRSTSDASAKRYAELLDELDEPALLVFALLFHNMGALPATLELARTACERTNAPLADGVLLDELLTQRSSLIDSMTGRDLDDPSTARVLAARVGTIERLKQLTVLDYATLSVLKPDSMSAWRFDQLWRLYSATSRELTRALETDRIEEVPHALASHPEFARGFPVRYLRAHSEEEFDAHIHLYELSRPTGVAVHLDRLDSAYRLTVVARDMPALFASFAGSISSFGFDILKAEAFSNANGIVLDTFVFADPRRTLELNPPEADRLQELIRRVALGKTDAQRLLRARPTSEPKRRSAPARVEFDNEACATATLVQIDAEDRPGLLYSLASAISASACNIDVVLIDTKGRRALDVFYVAHHGHKLTPEMRTILREKLVAAC